MSNNRFHGIRLRDGSPKKDGNGTVYVKAIIGLLRRKLEFFRKDDIMLHSEQRMPFLGVFFSSMTPEYT